MTENVIFMCVFFIWQLRVKLVTIVAWHAAPDIWMVVVDNAIFAMKNELNI